MRGDDAGRRHGGGWVRTAASGGPEASRWRGCTAGPGVGGGGAGEDGVASGGGGAGARGQQRRPGEDADDWAARPATPHRRGGLGPEDGGAPDGSARAWPAMAATWEGDDGDAADGRGRGRQWERFGGGRPRSSEGADGGAPGLVTEDDTAASMARYGRATGSAVAAGLGLAACRGWLAVANRAQGDYGRRRGETSSGRARLGRRVAMAVPKNVIPAP